LQAVHHSVPTSRKTGLFSFLAFLKALSPHALQLILETGKTLKTKKENRIEILRFMAESFGISKQTKKLQIPFNPLNRDPHRPRFMEIKNPEVLDFRVQTYTKQF
jgi:hypothetical protein